MGDGPSQHAVCEQFFANREPSLPEWRELRAAGVPLDALCRPQMVLAGDLIVDGPHRFGFTAKVGAAPERAFLIAITDEGDRFIDIAAWQPARNWLGLWLGSGWALGQGGIDDPRLGAEGALPVWRSPLNWLRAGRDGIVIIRPEAAASLLDGAGPLLAEDVAHARALRELLTRAGPRILLRAPSVRAA